MVRSAAALFQPLEIGSLRLPNRIVMAPMGRSAAQNGVLVPAYVPYYRRRAEGGAGLIIGEATGVNKVALSQDTSPFFHGKEALARWAEVCTAIHAAGGHFMPQLWHAGLARAPGTGPYPDLPSLGPSGWYIPNADENLKRRPGYQVGEPMTTQQMDNIIEDFATAATAAKAMGCDGVEIHGAHGYIFDQFFWTDTNRRTDAYGSSNFRDRTRFAAETIGEIRRRCGADFPIFFRFSQWKIQDYAAEIVRNPVELEQLLLPLAEAGVSAFHVSTRRFWEPAFAESDLSLAGWTRKIAGLPTIAVGSVGLDGEFGISASGTYQEFLDQAKSDDKLDVSQPASLDKLLEMFERGEFDLVAVGRGMIANADWANLVRSGALHALKSYHRHMLTTLD